MNQDSFNYKSPIQYTTHMHTCVPANPSSKNNDIGFVLPTPLFLLLVIWAIVSAPTVVPLRGLPR